MLKNPIQKMLFCIFSFLCLQSVQAADLKTYKDVYQKESEAILQTFQTKFSDLQLHYQKTLEALRASAQNQGDLTKTKAAIAEMERFQKTNTLPATPDENEIQEIKALQSDYVRQYSILERDMTLQLGTLTSKYDQALDRLQKELVKALKLDEATAVEAEQIQVRNAVKGYADQLTALKGPAATNNTVAAISAVHSTSRGSTDALKEIWNMRGKSSRPKVRLIDKDSMPPYAANTRRNDFPVQESDNPTGPFSGKAVYFDQRTGCKDVVYSVQSIRTIKQVHWKGAAMTEMTIEVLDPKGTSLAKCGPYGGGNNWAEFTVDFKPCKQFLIRIRNNASNWFLIDSIDLIPDDMASLSGGESAVPAK